MSFYKAYFIIGLAGLIVTGVKNVIFNDIDMTMSLIFYIAASILLLLAVNEKNRRSTSSIAVGTFALLSIMITLAADSLFSKFVIHALYGIPIYTLVLFQTAKLAIAFRNIGYAIMAAACLIVLTSLLAELYGVYVERDMTLAYSLGIGASSVAFILVGIGFLTSIMVAEHSQLKALVLRDPLTGMYNRRGLDYLVQMIIPSSHRYKKCMSAIAIDIDFFKKINDTYGHDGGDAVLRAFAAMILECPRASDVSCRLGGEEFVVVLPETSLEGALMIAERIRIRIVEMDVTFNDEIINLTASFGVSTQCDHINIDTLLKTADKALYTAKAGGRNRVCYSDTEHNVVMNEDIVPDTCIRS
jgi:diguanylate cyclase (GGDEF)-like protein